MKKSLITFFISLLLTIFSACETEAVKYVQSETENTTIVWKGSFADSSEIENPVLFYPKI